MPAGEMRSWVPVVLVMAIGLVAGCGGPESGGPSPAGTTSMTDEVPEAVVAEVNGVAIPRSRYEQMLEFIRGRLQGKDIERYLNAPFEALDAVVNDELIFQEATRVGTVVSEDEVEGEYARAVERAGGDEAFRTVLAAQGTTPESIREQVQRRLTIDAYIQQTVFPAVTLTEEELLDYYNSNLASFTPDLWVRVQRILVRCPPDSSPEEAAAARERAGKILGHLRSGSSFDQMAREYSEDQTASIGGHLGLIKRGAASPEFDAIAFSIATGEISDVFRDPLGFEILRVLERRGGEAKPFEEVREECEKRAMNDKREKAIRAVASKLRGMATIRTTLE